MLESNRVGLLLFIVLFLPVAAGCETTQSTTGDDPSRAGSLAAAMKAYHEGRYSQAEQQARQIMQSSTIAQRQEAAYLAGLSAYRLGKASQAEQPILIAMNSTRPEIEGKARAMMGIIRLDQGRPHEAVLMFDRAAQLLTGVEATRARQHAEMARFQTGDPTQYAVHNAAAGSQPAAGGGFSIQVGAFRQEQGARSAAADADSVASGAGLGPVRIISGSDDQGNQLYLVQFGRFPTRSAAAAARREIGRLDFIVSPTADPG